ncbi:MAG: hypothetical protein WC612_03275 [Bdellovibrionales bacterium]|jgi:hypothetical protein
MAGTTDADKGSLEGSKSREEVIAGLKLALQNGSKPKKEIIAEWRRATQCTKPTVGGTIMSYAFGGVVLFMGAAGFLGAVSSGAYAVQGLMDAAPAKDVLVGAAITVLMGCGGYEYSKIGFSLCRKTTAMWKARNAPALKQG